MLIVNKYKYRTAPHQLNIQRKKYPEPYNYVNTTD